MPACLVLGGGTQHPPRPSDNLFASSSSFLLHNKARRSTMAPEDKGSHAYANKRTPRTETLFQTGGIAYVYLCYGIHHLFNVVTGPKDIAHAVLIRAVEATEGIEVMKLRRKMNKATKNLTNGPGKLSQALGIKTSHDTTSIVDPDSCISIKLNKTPIPEASIISSPRVGIAYAKECALWPWRFRIKNNKWTSSPDEVHYEDFS